jgi:hypothetical protein
VPARRDFLAAGGSAVLTALAGCVSADDAATTRSTATTSTTTSEAPIAEPQYLPWGEPAAVQGTTLTPESVVVQDSAFYLATPDTLGVLPFEERQAVFVTVSVDGETRPAPDDFVLAVSDGASGWTAYEDVSADRFRERGRAYDPERGGDGWIGFAPETPVETPDPRLRVQFGSDLNGAVRWSLPDDAAATLREPPSFECRDFAVPSEVSPDQPIEVSVTVTNEGDGAGTFRAALNERGPTYRFETVELALDPGESRTWTGTVGTHVGVDEIDRVSVGFQSPCRDHQRTVTVADG